MVKKSRRCKSKTCRARHARHTRKRQQFGGGVETAKIYFHKNIKKQYPNIVHDAFLKRQGVVFPPVEDVEMYNENHVETKFKPMLDEIIGMTDNKELIDFVMQLYLTGNMGVPNSMENIGRLIDNANKFKVLKQNSVNDGKQLIPKDFPSLSVLEEFIHAKQGELQQIIEKKSRRSKTSALQKKLKEEGEDDVEVVLETPNYIVYHPTTEAGSKFYGRETRWCTAAEKHNRFSYYNQDGNLYIIQSKSTPQDKTQFHPNSVHPNLVQCMNPRDKPVSAEEIERLFQDEVLKKWFKDTLTQTLSTLPGSEHPLFYLNYGIKNQYTKGFPINFFNAVFDIGEMPEALNHIRTELLKNDSSMATTTLRPLSETDLMHIFKDKDFKEKFMQRHFGNRLGDSLFWDTKLNQIYPEYFDDEQTMIELLTNPSASRYDFNLLSNRLQRDYNFVKRLVSAKYEDDNPTKYCWPAYTYLSKENRAKLDELCKKIEMSPKASPKASPPKASPPKASSPKASSPKASPKV